MIRAARLVRVVAICCDVRVLAPVRRLLLVAVLLVGGFVTVGAAPAQAACTCQSSITTAQSIKVADAVFTGTVGDVAAPEPATAPATAVITNAVEVDRVYKGRIDTPQQVVGTTQRTVSTCGLGQLQTGRRYLFVVEAAGATAGEAAWTDDGCSGTRVATQTLLTEVEGILGAGEPATPPPPPPAAVLSDVDTAEPTSLSRAAAPGLALMLLGLLGLVLVHRAASRRA